MGFRACPCSLLAIENFQYTLDADEQSSLQFPTKLETQHSKVLNKQRCRRYQLSPISASLPRVRPIRCRHLDSPARYSDNAWIAMSLTHYPPTHPPTHTCDCVPLHENLITGTVLCEVILPRITQIYLEAGGSRWCRAKMLLSATREYRILSADPTHIPCRALGWRQGWSVPV